MEIRERNAEQDIKIRGKISIKKKWQPSVKQMAAKRAEEVSQEDTGDPAVDQVEQAAVATIDETAKIITPYRNEKRHGGRVSCSEAKNRQSAAKFTAGGAKNRGAAVPIRPKWKIRQTTQNTKNATKSLSVLAQKFADAVAKASSAMSGAIAGMAGGVVLLIVLCAVVIVGAVAASPFGIIFADEPQRGAIPLSEAIAQINTEFSAKLQELQLGDYNEVVIGGAPPDWREVVAIFAVKTVGVAGTETVVALDAEQIDALKAVFWDMTEIEHIIKQSESNDTITKVLYITIRSKSTQEISEHYSFTEAQCNMLDELLKNDLM